MHSAKHKKGHNQITMFKRKSKNVDYARVLIEYPNGTCREIRVNAGDHVAIKVRKAEMEEKYDEVPVFVNAVTITAVWGDWNCPDEEVHHIMIENPVDVDEVISKRDEMLARLKDEVPDLYELRVEYV